MPAEGPLAVVEPVRGAWRLKAACREARALGLAPGLALADARARVPGLAVVEHDPTADAALLDRLADGCDGVTPVVAVEPPDGITLDVTGCAHLLGGEARLRERLAARLGRQGVEVRAALAGTPDAARALARFGPPAPAPPGDEARALRTLPIAALELPEDVRLALARAGLKRVGDLADRPAAALASRFGPAVATRLRRVLGEEDRRLAPRRAAPPCVAEQAFAEPIGRTEDAEAALAMLLRRVEALLAARHQGGRAFEAAFFRTDGLVRRVRVSTGRPSRDAASLERLFRDRLDALRDPLDPGFGFDLIRLAVPVTEPLGPRQGDLDPGAAGLGRDAEEAVSDLVDRLAARFGADRVLRFVPVDSHDPLRAARTLPAAGTTPLSGWPRPVPGEPPGRPLQVFVPPEPIEALAAMPDGPPLRFRWRRVLHEVVLAEGPERIEGEWWHDGPRALAGALAGAPARDFYRIEDREGQRFWVFRVDGSVNGAEASPHPRWFLQGLFA